MMNTKYFSFEEVRERLFDLKNSLLFYRKIYEEVEGVFYKDGAVQVIIGDTETEIKRLEILKDLGDENEG